MTNAEQARRDTMAELGGDPADFAYITDDFITQVSANPLDHNWTDSPPVGESLLESGSGTRNVSGVSQKHYRGWVYRPVKFDDKYAFYWWENGCSSKSGYRSFDKWEKTTSFCEKTGDPVWRVEWWA